MSPKLPRPDDGHREDVRDPARERRRRILIDAPERRDPESADYLGEHGVRLEAVALVRRGDSFRVLTEPSR